LQNNDDVYLYGTDSNWWNCNSDL